MIKGIRYNCVRKVPNLGNRIFYTYICESLYKKELRKRIFTFYSFISLLHGIRV